MNKTRISAEQCTLEHFGKTEKLKKQFKNFNGLSIVCPNLAELSNLKLKGDVNLIKTKTLNFKAETCKGTSRLNKPCKSAQEIKKFLYDLQISPRLEEQEVDFKSFESAPTFWRSTAHPYLFNEAVSTLIFLEIRKNEIMTYDNYFVSFTETTKHQFFNSDKLVMFQSVPESTLGLFFEIRLEIDPINIIHQREMYNFLNLFEDLGGIIEIMMIIFGAICYPISEFSFNLETARSNQPKTNLVHFSQSFPKTFRSKVKLFYSLRWPKLSRFLRTYSEN